MRNWNEPKGVEKEVFSLSSSAMGIQSAMLKVSLVQRLSLVTPCVRLTKCPHRVQGAEDAGLPQPREIGVARPDRVAVLHGRAVLDEGNFLQFC